MRKQARLLRPPSPLGARLLRRGRGRGSASPSGTSPGGRATKVPLLISRAPCRVLGSFRPVIPVIHYIRNYVIRDMSLCMNELYMSLRHLAEVHISISTATTTCSYITMTGLSLSLARKSLSLYMSLRHTEPKLLHAHI